MCLSRLIWSPVEAALGGERPPFTGGGSPSSDSIGRGIVGVLCSLQSHLWVFTAVEGAGRGWGWLCAAAGHEGICTQLHGCEAVPDLLPLR